MEKRKIRCQELLKLRVSGTVLFSDVKIFTIKEHLNAQNDRIYAIHAEDIPLSLRIAQRRQKPPSVMVWGGISGCGKNNSFFWNRGLVLMPRSTLMISWSRWLHFAMRRFLLASNGSSSKTGLLATRPE